MPAAAPAITSASDQCVAPPALPCLSGWQFHEQLSQDPRHQLIYFGLIVDVSGLWCGVAIRHVGSCTVGIKGRAEAAVACGQLSPVPQPRLWVPLQASAWSPGAFEEAQRAAGFKPYSNGSPIGRDRNVHLK